MVELTQPEKKAIEELESRVTPFYGGQDFAHDFRHGLRVMRWVRLINQGERGDAFLVEAGALLHQMHDALKELRVVLEECDIPGGDIGREALYDIVRVCRPPLISDSSTLEARVVFDADACELFGAYGILREVSCNILVRGLDFDRAAAEAKSVQELFYGRLQTETGRDLAREMALLQRQFWLDFEQGIPGSAV